MHDPEHGTKGKRDIKGQYRRRVGGDDHRGGKSHLCCHSGSGDRGDAKNSNRRYVYQHDDPSKGHGQFRVLNLLRNESGNTLVALLVAFTLLVFLLMQPIDTFVFQAKHQMAENIMHKYLARMRLEGYLTIQDENNLIADFENIKCPIETPATDIVANARESNGDSRILRSADPVTSELILQVTCKPDPQPFSFMQLLGGAGGETTITVGGKELSERVNP